MAAVLCGRIWVVSLLPLSTFTLASHPRFSLAHVRWRTFRSAVGWFPGFFAARSLCLVALWGSLQRVGFLGNLLVSSNVGRELRGASPSLQEVKEFSEVENLQGALEANGRGGCANRSAL